MREHRGIRHAAVHHKMNARARHMRNAVYQSQIAGRTNPATSASQHHLLSSFHIRAVLLLPAANCYENLQPFESGTLSRRCHIEYNFHTAGVANVHSGGRRPHRRRGMVLVNSGSAITLSYDLIVSMITYLQTAPWYL